MSNFSISDPAFCTAVFVVAWLPCDQEMRCRPGFRITQYIIVGVDAYHIIRDAAYIIEARPQPRDTGPHLELPTGSRDWLDMGLLVLYIYKAQR